MIKEQAIIREPRGISWQNWTATCKDTLASNRKPLLVAALLLMAGLGGICLHRGYEIYAKHSSPMPSPADVHPLQNHSGLTSTVQPLPSPDPAPTPTVQHSVASLQPHTDNACENKTRHMIKADYHAKRAAENTRHAEELTVLRTPTLRGPTSSISNLPDLISSEENRHANVLHDLLQTETDALEAIGCK